MVPQEPGSINYTVNALSATNKNLFLFENEFTDHSVNEQQVPKLLAKIKLGNEHGRFEPITALVDSGSDASLIKLTRLQNLFLQNQSLLHQRGFKALSIQSLPHQRGFKALSIQSLLHHC